MWGIKGRFSSLFGFRVAFNSVLAFQKHVEDKKDPQLQKMKLQPDIDKGDYHRHFKSRAGATRTDC